MQYFYLASIKKMLAMKKNFVLPLLLLFTIPVFAQVSIPSPDGKFQLHFALTDSIPFYQLKYQDRTIVHKSRLGLELVNQPSLLDGFLVTDKKTSRFRETWKPVMGEESSILNNYEELEITLMQAKTKRQIILRFRLFNDGLGFRYEFPQQPNLNYFIIKEEKTEIALKEDYHAWWIPGDYDTEEYKYTTSRLSEIPALFDKSYENNASQQIVPSSVQTPLMIKSADGKHYINIHEAELVGYPGYCLDFDATTYTFRSHLTPDAQGNKGHIQTPFHTPWRTIVVAPAASAILMSRMILNLNEPTSYASTDWIKPVKYIGVWWEMIFGKKNLELYQSRQCASGQN